MNRISLYISISIAVLITGCSDYEESLGAKYQIIRTNGSEVVIVRSNSVIGRVESIDTKPPYVTGYMISIEPPASYADTAIGYFVIDTAEDKCKTELSKDAWEAELKRLNWVKPNLHSPH